MNRVISLYISVCVCVCVFEAEKCEDDMEREAQLLEWRLTLTEERNAVMVPFSGSGIPGAPAEWYVPGAQVLRACGSALVLFC